MLTLEQSNRIRDYSNKVCEQIRWKKARQYVSKEIENHIYDQRDAFIKIGLDQENATEKAINEMGDPIKIGMDLDIIHKPKPQWLMISITMIIFLIGIISKSAVNDGSLKIILPSILGFVAFVTFYFIDYSILGKYPKVVFLAVVMLSILIIPFSNNVNGSPYFLSININLRHLFLIFPLAFSCLIYSMRNNGYIGIIICGLGYIFPSALLFNIATFSEFCFYSLSCFILLLLSINKGWFHVKKDVDNELILLPSLILVILFSFIILRSPYIINRITTFINPYSDPLGSGYFNCTIRDLINNSVFLGSGNFIDVAHQQILTSPEFKTDFLLTNLIYNYGFITFGIIILLFTVFIFISLKFCFNQKSILGFLVSLSIMFSFIWQTIIYISGNLGYYLCSSLSLPLISYNNQALILNMALIGLLLSIFRTGDVTIDRFAKKIFSIDGNKIIINIK